MGSLRTAACRRQPGDRESLCKRARRSSHQPAAFIVVGKNAAILDAAACADASSSTLERTDVEAPPAAHRVFSEVSSLSYVCFAA